MDGRLGRLRCREATVRADAILRHGGLVETPTGRVACSLGTCYEAGRDMQKDLQRRFVMRVDRKGKPTIKEV